VFGGLAVGATIGGAIANGQAQANAASYCAQRYQAASAQGGRHRP
jgi:hypothetical protein